MSAEENLEQIAAATAATELQTVEQQSAQAASLEHEKEGYQARLARLADGKPDPASRERLEALSAGVDVELARLGRGKPKTRRKAKAEGSKPE